MLPLNLAHYNLYRPSVLAAEAKQQGVAFMPMMPMKTHTLFAKTSDKVQLASKRSPVDLLKLTPYTPTASTEGGAKRDTNTDKLKYELLENVAFEALVPKHPTLKDALLESVQALGKVPLSVVSSQAAKQTLSKPPKEATKPMLSVIVPTYNLERFIEETLESIKQQTYPNKEIIVVDDGSTDGTKDKIKAFMQANSETLNIRLLELPHVGTPSVTRNIAAAHFLNPASQLVTYMDGDDYYANPQALAHLVKPHQQNKALLASVGDFALVSEQGQTLQERLFSTHNSETGKSLWREELSPTWENLLHKMHNQCQSVMVKREHLPVIPYFKTGEDMAFFTDIYAAICKQKEGVKHPERYLSLVPEVVFNYRQRQGSITNSKESLADFMPKLEGLAEVNRYCLEHTGIPKHLRSDRLKRSVAGKIWSYHLLKELQRGTKDNLGNIAALLIKAQQEGYANLRAVAETGLNMLEQYLNPKALAEKIRRFILSIDSESKVR